MKVLWIAFLTVLGAATLSVDAQNVDMAKPMMMIKSVIQMCREVSSSLISEDIANQCKRENAKNITSECFPEVNGDKGTCIMKCLNPDASNEQELSAESFVETLLTKKRKMCIVGILKDCVEDKTGFMMP